MSSIMKVFLLFAAVMFCISEAKFDDKGQNCLCRSTRDKLSAGNKVKDIQIYPKTVFCDNVEIVVTDQNGLRFCLNPNVKVVKKLIARIMSAKRSRTTAATPTSSSLAQ
ncbi:interleukin-8-like [Sphaeramia orbicularis]|uniref:Interleukin-8-like n=1 Tax=Sphaeramia orbicularis TaxID=375764 RepID=A0A672ZN73_9TELE|nr:interleukin-8-like [Sphaeramia orbicularis]